MRSSLEYSLSIWWDSYLSFSNIAFAEYGHESSWYRQTQPYQTPIQAQSASYAFDTFYLHEAGHGYKWNRRTCIFLLSSFLYGKPRNFCANFM